MSGAKGIAHLARDDITSCQGGHLSGTIPTRMVPETLMHVLPCGVHRSPCGDMSRQG